MNRAELFVVFLSLLRVYCHEEQSIDFYSDKLGVHSDELLEVIFDVSGSSFGEWMETMLERVAPQYF